MKILTNRIDWPAELVARLCSIKMTTPSRHFCGGNGRTTVCCRSLD